MPLWYRGLCQPGPALSDIFREIEEELRRESLQQLWKRYGNFIIALAVIIVIATAGVMGWRAYRERVREAEGVQFAAALDLSHQGKNAEAAAAFAELARNASGGRATLASLEEAASKVKAGDKKGAIAIYNRLAADDSVDSVFRNVAVLLSARYQLDAGDPRAVIAQLQPLASGSGPWRGLAAQLTALAELKAGDRAKARADFETLAKDASQAQGTRQLAAGMAAAIAP